MLKSSAKHFNYDSTEQIEIKVFIYFNVNNIWVLKVVLRKNRVLFFFILFSFFPHLVFVPSFIYQDCSFSLAIGFSVCSHCLIYGRAFGAWAQSP